MLYAVAYAVHDVAMLGIAVARTVHDVVEQLQFTGCQLLAFCLAVHCIGDLCHIGTCLAGILACLSEEILGVNITAEILLKRGYAVTAHHAAVPVHKGIGLVACGKGTALYPSAEIVLYVYHISSVDNINIAVDTHRRGRCHLVLHYVEQLGAGRRRELVAGHQILVAAYEIVASHSSQAAIGGMQRLLGTRNELARVYAGISHLLPLGRVERELGLQTAVGIEFLSSSLRPPVRHAHGKKSGCALAEVAKQVDRLNLYTCGKLLCLCTECKDCRLGTEHTCRGCNFLSACQSLGSLTQRCAYCPERHTCSKSLAKGTGSLFGSYAVAIEHIVDHAVRCVVCTECESLSRTALRNTRAKGLQEVAVDDAACHLACQTARSTSCHQARGKIIGYERSRLANNLARQTSQAREHSRIEYQRTDSRSKVLAAAGVVSGHAFAIELCLCVGLRELVHRPIERLARERIVERASADILKAAAGSTALHIVVVHPALDVGLQEHVAIGIGADTAITCVCTGNPVKLVVAYAVHCASHHLSGICCAACCAHCAQGVCSCNLRMLPVDIGRILLGTHTLLIKFGLYPVPVIFVDSIVHHIVRQHKLTATALLGVGRHKTLPCRIAMESAALLLVGKDAACAVGSVYRCLHTRKVVRRHKCVSRLSTRHFKVVEYGVHTSLFSRFGITVDSSVL